MINLIPDSTNNFIIYADTVTPGTSEGNYFVVVFTNSWSKQTFAVNPSIIRRNTRFVELEVELVAVNEQNDPYNGKIYLYPEGNYTYTVFNTNQPTLDPYTQPLSCAVWSTEEDFWNFTQLVWSACEITYNIIDRGQAFLYSDDNECEREIEFVPYVSGNNILDAVVYVTGIPLYQFPCTIGTVPGEEDYVVSVDTTTYCQTITIETGASLTVSGTAVLTQTGAPYGYC
jgi:hypothetical protein